MPIYEFECEKCGNKFEEFCWPEEDTAKLTCPKCGESEFKKLMSSFSKSSGKYSCKPMSFG
jgi:putative FmdB family regulatory protein